MCPQLDSVGTLLLGVAEGVHWLGVSMQLDLMKLILRSAAALCASVL